MKKYKLIKKYPGSPELGTIITEGNHYGYFGFIVNSTPTDPTKYPEYWEEVVKKDYEILSIKVGSKGKPSDMYEDDKFKWSTDGDPKYETLNQIIKKWKNHNDKEIYIISIKRLSDGEIFTIGDKIKDTLTNCITNLSEITSKDIRCFLNGVNISYVEKVIEKDYEILSFKTNSGKLSLLQSNGNYFVEDNTGGVKFNPDGYYRGHTVEEELKHDSKIHSVKRMSDGEVFTVGDIINTKVDNKYKQEIIEINLGINDKFFKDRLTFKTKIGVVVINIAVKSKQSLVTKVVEKDYEILSLTSIESPTRKEKVVWYFDKENNGWTIDEPERAYYKDIPDFTSIHSIKRLSDGKVFTIGDKVKTSVSDSYCSIYSFNVKNNTLVIDCTHSYLAQRQNVNLLEDIQHYSKPLFTTEDGVDISEGDTYYPVCEYFNLHNRCTYPTGHKMFKLFSTQKAAEEYISMNKSKYSLNDILASLPNRKCEKYTSIKQMIENLKNM